LWDVAANAYTSLKGSGSSDFFPIWSPDGARILFVSNAFGDFDLWILGADGENLVQVTKNAGYDVEPDWIPGGPYIVFASIRGEDADFELYIMRADCASPDEGCEDDLVQLTDNDVDDINPAWAP
jgi:Tol biopolymer transport system component